MLTQLLPSSTVAVGVKLKIGLGTVASEIPGGTCQPQGTTFPVTEWQIDSGGTREPLQYWATKPGAVALLALFPPPYPDVFVSTECVGASVKPEPWLVGPVSPRTPMSQNAAPAGHAPVVAWLGAAVLLFPVIRVPMF